MIANALNITPGTELQFEIVDGNILLKPQTHPQYTLDELLEGITPETIHSEIDWGNPVAQRSYSRQVSCFLLGLIVLPSLLIRQQPLTMPPLVPQLTLSLSFNSS
ncbi:MAG: hypothetical protein H7126_03995 [Candidatus Parcubacteria bacterium]|nr:hypothetical protein [Leptolyngbyaceae cyanobacterium LF-bin-113]